MDTLPANSTLPASSTSSVNVQHAVSLESGLVSQHLEPLRIAALQLPTIVGDPVSATDAVLAAYQQVADTADLVVTPELVLSGYPPQDLLLRSAFIDLIDQQLSRLCEATRTGPALLVGLPTRTTPSSMLDATPRQLFNAAVLLVDGEIVDVYAKQLLPTYAVFDEARYFVPGLSSHVITVQGHNIGVLICEDLWSDTPLDRLVSAASKRALSGLVVLNASPFHSGKQQQRQQASLQAASRLDVPVLYVDAVGATDELVFDGGSHVMDASGTLTSRLPAFTAGVLHTVFPAPASRFTAATTFVPQTVSPVAPWPARLEELYCALVEGLSIYVHKNGFDHVFLGLSGGIDSALAATLAVDALGADHVTGVALPSRFSSQGSIDDAVLLANQLGCVLHQVPLSDSYDQVLTMLGSLEGFDEQPFDVAHQNIQARLRSIVLMGFANKCSAMVIATGNKSEMALGYATLYGDMAGGFAPLKDLYKTDVFALSYWRNATDLFPGQPIPVSTLTKPPSAELAPDQSDESDLGSYDVIDAVLKLYIDQDMDPAAIAAATLVPLSTVVSLTDRVDHNEYKRRQAPVGIRLSSKALGADRRLPISVGDVC